METKSPLTVVILTKNESKRITDCIRSVSGFASEVLIIDDESSDDTIAVAESLGARVLQRKMDNEGRHRNWANEQASNEWILSLDADERVMPELAEDLKRITGGDAEHVNYAIPRRNYIGQRWIRHCGWYPSAQLKLWKKGSMQWEEASVHPRAISNNTCGQLQTDIIHYSYRDLKDFVDKMNRHTTLEAEKWVESNRKMPMGKALWRSVDRFFRAYIGKKGYKEGFMGFVIASLGGWYQILSYAKFREMKDLTTVTSE